MVYIINAQDCFESDENLSVVRNRLFTAITRSKAWVRVLGVGTQMRGLIEEFERVRSNDFRLAFRYPHAQQMKRLKIVNRDMPTVERRRYNRTKVALEKYWTTWKAAACNEKIWTAGRWSA